MDTVAMVAALPGLDDFSSWFDGDFDNYPQVLEDRRAGLLPGEGGGHEHIHLSLTTPVQPAAVAALKAVHGTGAARIARYYFNGDPTRVFRLRLYTLHPLPGGGGALEMRLYRPTAAVDAMLREGGYDPEMVSRALIGVGVVDGGDGGGRGRGSSEGGGAQGPEPAVERLCGCEVLWRPLARGAVASYGGEMDGGGCTVTSQFDESVEVFVEDELELTADMIDVHDRGFDKAGNWLYGNRRGVPYRLQRVAQPAAPGDTERAAAGDDELRWTLGSAHRSAELYRERLAALEID